MKYKLDVKRNEFEFSFEEETFKAFKDGLQPFIDLAESYGTPISNHPSNGSKTSKRAGGKRPPFVKGPVLELIKKEPEWVVYKFAEDFTDKIKTQYGVVGAKVKSVKVVLIRLYQDRLLTRKDIQGRYAYSVLKVPQ